MRPLHTGICEVCGVPNVWAKDSVLDCDNTSLQKMLPMRGVFYEAQEVAGFVDRMESALGVSLQDLIFTAHKRAIRRFFEGTLKGITGRVARLAVPKMIYEQQSRVAPVFGVGLMRIENYGRGGPYSVVASNTWNERLLAGEVAGAFEAVQGCECEVESERMEDGLRIVLRATGREREEYSGRLAPLTGTLIGDLAYPRCHACGAPISFRVFRWDRSLGEIRERDTGIRVAHMTIACFDSLLVELVGELGDEARDMAVRQHADQVRDSVSAGDYDSLVTEPSDRERTYFDHLSLIRRRCFGNPLYIDSRPGELKVHIRNPANDVMLTGRVLGTFEAVEGLPGRAETHRSDGMLEVIATSV